MGEQDRDAIAAYGNKGARLIFSELVGQYMRQWTGKDIEHQLQRSRFWAKTFAEHRLDEIVVDKIHTELTAMKNKKCRKGDGRGKSAGKTKHIDILK